MADITAPTIGATGWGTTLNTALGSLQTQINSHGVVLPAGSSSSDFQDAIDGLEADGGGVIQLEEGDYTVNGTIDLGTKVFIKGVGQGTVISQVHTSDPLFLATAKLRFGISDLYLNGPGSGSGEAIKLLKGGSDDVSHYYLRNIVIGDFGGDGVEVENGIVSDITGVQVNNAGGWGFNIHGQSAGAAGTSTNLVNCYANNCGSGGYYIEKMTYSNLIGCASDNSPKNYFVKNCEGLVLQGCGAEASETTGNIFEVDGSSSQVVTIIGGWTYEQLSGAAFLKATDGAYVIMIGCRTNSPVGGNWINCAATAHVLDYGPRVGGLTNTGTTANIATTNFA